MDGCLNDPPFETAHLGLIGLNLLFATDSSLLKGLKCRIVIFLSHAESGFRPVMLQMGDCPGAQKLSRAVELSLGIGKLCPYGANLCLKPQLLLGSDSRPRCLKIGSGPVELPIERIESGPELIRSQLGNHLILDNFLPLPDWETDQQAGHLKGKLDLFGGLDDTRKGPRASFSTSQNKDRFDRSDDIDGLWFLTGASSNSQDQANHDILTPWRLG